MYISTSCPICKTGFVRVCSQFLEYGNYNSEISCSICQLKVEFTSIKAIDFFTAMEIVYKELNQHKIDIWKNLK
jgi:transcription elongation factor Elf1